MTEALRILDQISTHWSLVRQAHEGTPESAAAARSELVLRYKDAIWWYVRAIAKADPDVTDEIAQRVFVRIMEGKCHRAYTTVYQIG